jgi:3-hydroxyacyl-CoA dehydrogenase
MKRVLIVCVGALGGTIAARAISAGIPVWLATNSIGLANARRATGLQVSGVGGKATASSVQVALENEEASYSHYLSRINREWSENYD